jgi:hypothetical protein
MARLTAAALVLGLATAAAPAGAADLCATLTIPPELGLTCAPVADRPGEVAVEPASGQFAGLSRLTLRELRKDGPDALAWTDPRAWLRQQLTVNTGDVAGALRGLAESPDSPLAGPGAAGAVGAISSFLDRLARVALLGCEDAEEKAPGRIELRCRYEVAGLAVQLTERVAIAGDRRWALVMRTMNEQRLRHLEAIANSFQPG